MVHIPRALAAPSDRIHGPTRIPGRFVIREMSFDGGAWILAAKRKAGTRQGAKVITVGRC